MSDPITRCEWLTRAALIAGVSSLVVGEAVASVALSHEPGWLAVMVDPVTGEPAP